jgi:molybdopterin/thiamine biosynthesis adenylyltransferase
MTQTRRYTRQELVPAIGAAGQAGLARARVVVVGAGALGCQSADLLARAGIGSLTLIDRDVVELSNLQRQTLFDERDAFERASKALAAERRLRAVNSTIQVRGVAADFRARNALQLLQDALVDTQPGDVPSGVIVDGTDNFQTRYLLNDCAVKLGVPYVYGGVIATRGMAAVFAPAAAGPCMRCVFPDPPAPGSMPTCDTAGVLGPAVAVVGAHQAAMTLRCIIEGPASCAGTLVDFDLWRGEHRRINMHRTPGCVCCEGRQFDSLDGIQSDDDTTQYCGSDAVQVWPARNAVKLRLTELAERLASIGPVAHNAAFVRVSIDAEVPDGQGIELTVFADGRAIVRGTTLQEVARGIYAKYVGA